MAYCTLEEAWGPNFFNDSMKKIAMPKQNGFLETTKSLSNFSRSYNTLPNTNGPASRYVSNNSEVINNADVNNEQVKELDPKLIENVNINHNQHVELHKNKVNNQLDDLHKQNNIYKKYLKKCKKMIDVLNSKMDDVRSNSKLYLILLICSLVFNLILLIILVIVISLK